MTVRRTTNDTSGANMPNSISSPAQVERTIDTQSLIGAGASCTPENFQSRFPHSITCADRSHFFRHQLQRDHPYRCPRVILADPPQMLFNLLGPVVRISSEGSFRGARAYFKVRRHYHAIRARIAPRRIPQEFVDRRAIFIHIPKAAGNSVTQSLFGKPSVELGAHARACDWRRAEPMLFAACFKFAFTRHPVDRFVSAFAFLKQGGITPADVEWAQVFLRDCADVSAFLQRMQDRSFRTEVLSYPHFIPQWRFVCDPKGRVIVDFVGRFERISEDFEFVRQRLGFMNPLEVLNETKGDMKQRQSVSPSEIELIAQIYKKDMDLFGYSG